MLPIIRTCIATPNELTLRSDSDLIVMVMGSSPVVIIFAERPIRLQRKCGFATRKNFLLYGSGDQWSIIARYASNMLFELANWAMWANQRIGFTFTSKAYDQLDRTIAAHFNTSTEQLPMICGCSPLNQECPALYAKLGSNLHPILEIEHGLVQCTHRHVADVPTDSYFVIEDGVLSYGVEGNRLSLAHYCDDMSERLMHWCLQSNQALQESRFSLK
jgi:hypothetical protein